MRRMITQKALNGLLCEIKKEESEVNEVLLHYYFITYFTKCEVHIKTASHNEKAAFERDLLFDDRYETNSSNSSSFVLSRRSRYFS